MLHKPSRLCQSILCQFMICAVTALILMAAAVPALAQNEAILYYFNPVDPMGSAANPWAGLVRDSAGNLYGVGFGGKYRAGVVFKLDANGVYSTLYTFTGGSAGSNDGCIPRAALILDDAGNLYGTTSHCGSAAQAGNVFKLDPAGNETILHTFTGGADGAVPLASLYRDQAGNLYGTTSAGGDTSCSYYGVKGCGTIFKISAAGKFSLLHTFAGADGAAPMAGLTEDSSGNFYGTAAGGGTAFYGTVYKMDKTGHVTLLYSFNSGANPDGDQPASTPVLDSAGNLYGTTTAGGNFNDCYGFGCGTVFKLDSAGNETLLHMFNGNTDGALPSSLLIDGKGNLYGEAAGDETFYDTVFKVDPLGNFSVLHGFGGNGDGTGPCCSLVSDRLGNLYGATMSGGYANNGVIFKISVPQ
jgi:uncharacterized repeat protein (TIGR03803 family)